MEAGPPNGQLASIPSLVGVPDAIQAAGAGPSAAPWAYTMQLPVGSELDRIKLQLRLVGTSPALQPALCRARYPGELALYEQQGIIVHDWVSVKRRGPHLSRSAPLMRQLHHQIKPEGVISKQPLKGPSARGNKGKLNNAGRTYTSKYRGVHQTFPTRRWEAQFRRSGKPTSLGCFDAEEQAAKAYDKMMLWCELHNASGMKGGITNFDPVEYEQDVTWLSSVTQDELIEALRSDGRRQAAHRMMRHKSRDGSAESDMGEDGQEEGQQDEEQEQQEEEGQERYQQGQEQYQQRYHQQRQQWEAHQRQQQQQQDGPGLYQLPPRALPMPPVLRLDPPPTALPPGLEASTAAAAAAAALARAGLVGSALGRQVEQQLQAQQGAVPGVQGQVVQQGAVAGLQEALAAVAAAAAAAERAASPAGHLQAVQAGTSQAGGPVTGAQGAAGALAGVAGAIGHAALVAHAAGQGAQGRATPAGTAPAGAAHMQQQQQQQQQQRLPP